MLFSPYNAKYNDACFIISLETHLPSIFFSFLKAISEMVAVFIDVSLLFVFISSYYKGAKY